MTSRTFSLGFLLALPFLCSFLALAAVPSDLQLPGTQPLQVSGLGAVTGCENCHGGYDKKVEPHHLWQGGMMAQAGRDPVFWATLAVAEQDFAGVGDFCLRCHAQRGWLEGRAAPTDGSGLTSADVNGVECSICHKLTDPNGLEHKGVQTAPYVANDGGTPPTGYYGSGMGVLWNGKERLGPYRQTAARHSFLQSRFHRSGDLCGTCHDVSNSLVGDLAHDNGAQTPLAPGTFLGKPGGPVGSKAAFNNFPFQYGIVERTYSEYKASRLDTTRVSAYAQLPAELRGGALERAHAQAQQTGRGGDYEDGTARYFTCQSCHMPPVTGRGSNKSNSPLRKDLPWHDLTGGNDWVPQAIIYLDGKSRLRLGGGLSAGQIEALRAGVERARRQLELAAKLEVAGRTLKVINRTGHKLISGYPEGRRMWVNLKWLGEKGELLREDGAYGRLDVKVGSTALQVESLLDLTGANTRIYEAKFGLTAQWAGQLLGLGLPSGLVLDYDRVTGAPGLTLGQLAASPAGTVHPSFHFVLNNTIKSDNRIPPYGMDHDEAKRRNILPVPATQYGDPGPKGTYRHWDEIPLNPPSGAVAARIELLYQPTSWEYVLFLERANQGKNAFLAQEGQYLLDAWLNTGMAKPHPMAATSWCGRPGSGEDLVLESEVDGGGRESLCVKEAKTGSVLEVEVGSPGGAFTGVPAVLALQAHPTGSAPPSFPLPHLHLGRFDLVLPVPSLASSGYTFKATLPPGGAGYTLRFQALALSPKAANGMYAATAAHDILVR